MTPNEINKRCHEILGIHWHERKREFPFRMCVCGVFDCQADNYDFYDDPVALLREMEKQEWYFDFIKHIDDMVVFDDTCEEMRILIDTKNMTTPGLLATKLVEWEG